MEKKFNPQEACQAVAAKIVQHLGYLRDRWQDEKEYEDFNDYILSAKKCIESAGAEFISLKKRPFEVTFSKDGLVANFRILAGNAKLSFDKKELEEALKNFKNDIQEVTSDDNISEVTNNNQPQESKKEKETTMNAYLINTRSKKVLGRFANIAECKNLAGPEVIAIDSIESLCEKLALTEITSLYNANKPEDAQPIKKFSDKPSGAKRVFTILETMEFKAKSDGTKKTRQRSGVRSNLRALFSSEDAAFTMEELQEKLGATYDSVANNLAYLKNKKYCGSDGVLVIKRGDDKKYRVIKEDAS